MKKHMKIAYERGLFLKLNVLFVVVTVLYYVSATWATIVSLVIAIADAYILNRNEIVRMKAVMPGELHA